MMIINGVLSKLNTGRPWSAVRDAAGRAMTGSNGRGGAETPARSGGPSAWRCAACRLSHILNAMKDANNAPVYACMYAELATIARGHGYALACHGSLARDFDLCCIPWVRDAADPADVVAAMCSKFAIRQVGEPEQKEHGRVAYTISLAWGHTALDLSFMPRVPG